MAAESFSADAIEQAIVHAISAACRLELGTVDSSTSLLEACTDSLTLVAALSQIELVCGVSFDADAIAEMLRARDVGELVAAVSRKLESRGRSNPIEIAGNADCAPDEVRVK